MTKAKPQDHQRIVINPAKHQGRGGAAWMRNYQLPQKQVAKLPTESWWIGKDRTQLNAIAREKFRGGPGIGR